MRTLHSILFDTFASLYDGVVAALTRHLGGPRVLGSAVAEAAGARPGLVAVDVCCGTGLAASALAEAGCATVGVDASASMPEMAKRKLPPRVMPVLGDAARLPLRGWVRRHRYGVALLIRAEQGTRPLALSEARRILRGGGRLAALDYRVPR